MSTKKNFEVFSQSWPKGGAARPVRGERGIHDLPSGEEGGENMDLESHYRHKQHTFDVFCKRTSKHKAAPAVSLRLMTSIRGNTHPSLWTVM